MPQPEPSLRDILLLLTIPQIGPGRVRRLLSIFPSVEELLHTPLRRLTRIDGIDEKLARQIKTGGDPTVVEEQLRRMETEQVHCLTIWDDRYPPLLKKINDPPVVLFYRGELPSPWPPCVGVVGTRMPSQYGRSVTEKLVAELSRQGIAVVSGLARGVDTLAHSVTIRHGGLTYAVLGCGVDYVYPPENRKLYQQIAQQGAVLSEFFLGTQPDAVNFPRRNRIISGMSAGVLVVEAGTKSGALITAAYALEQNREVFAVPGSIFNDKSRGTNRLIQQGAKLVTRVEDILEEIGGILQSSAPAEKPLPPNLSQEELKLLNHLSGEPKHIDRLVAELNESPAVLLARLLTLELMGLVKQLSGKMFIRL
ncbi:MAG: DNA-protecting protein DprA [Calditrichaeota bacterium]|nr:MAG: DNA-protecting protein DprA [Calditrichota bacterium]